MKYWYLARPVRDPFEYIADKKKIAADFIDYAFLRLQEMFVYKNLPEYFPKEIFEDYLFSNGTCAIAKEGDKIYAFNGAFGGEPDPYYRPTLYVVANPALKLSKKYEIGKDCVLMRNDYLYKGLTPLANRYACLLTENILTINLATILLRSPYILNAPTDKEYKSATMAMQQIIAGKPGVITDSLVSEGMKMLSPPSNNGSYLTQFIELYQFLIAGFLHEIGIDENGNMKREAILKDESDKNKQALLPFCQQMLRCRREDWAKVNEMFGTNVEVDFSETWKLTTSQLGMVGDENADIETNGSSPKGTAEDNGSPENIEFDSEPGERNSDVSDKGDSVQESRGDGGVVRGESGASTVNGDEFELDVHVSGSVEEGTSSLETGRVESENEKEKENG
jgi:hypothetical protein